MRVVPWRDAAEDPDGQDDEQGAHPGASVAGSQRLRDHVVALERDGQYREYRRVRHGELDKRHQATCK